MPHTHIWTTIGFTNYCLCGAVEVPTYAPERIVLREVDEHDLDALRARADWVTSDGQGVVELSFGALKVAVHVKREDPLLTLDEAREILGPAFDD